MKRDSEPTISYDIKEEPFHFLLGISIPLMDLLLEQPNYSDLVGLYLFYYYTAKWQKTNRPKATISYTCEGMHWGHDKVRAVKKKLIDLGLIKDVQSRNENNKIIGHYIKVNFITRKATLLNSRHPHPPENKEGILNALSTNKSTADNIKKSQFDQFWEMYPKKVDKGKALTKWNQICNKPIKERPKWNDIRRALHKQKKSQRWQDQQYIPHATTWLNQSRWLDDPTEMISYDRNENKPKFVMDYGEKWYLDDDGKYYNDEGKLLM